MPSRDWRFRVQDTLECNNDVLLSSYHDLDNLEVPIALPKCSSTLQLCKPDNHIKGTPRQNEKAKTS